jgi:hypothetical protein
MIKYSTVGETMGKYCKYIFVWDSHVTEIERQHVEHVGFDETGSDTPCGFL